MKKLAIVGSGSNTRGAAPWADDTFDIWVFNEAANMSWCKRWTAVFQIHPEEIYTGVNTKDTGHWEWLQKDHGRPVYMQERDPRVPDSVRFPLEDALALTGLDYFASTFAYMAALALLQNYELVEIHGIELSMSEYEYQAGCWRFWIGVLIGRLGKDRVIIRSGLDLFSSPRYGYEGNFAFGAPYFEERARYLENQWTAADRQLHNLKKAIERAVDNSQADKLQELIIQFRDTALSAGEKAGALFEAQRYAKFGDRFADRGGFEYAAATAQRDGEAKRQMVWHLGGMTEYAWLAWKQTGSRAALAQLMGLIGLLGETSQEVGALLGKYKENLSYVSKYDSIAKAGGAILLERPAELDQELEPVVSPV